MGAKGRERRGNKVGGLIGPVADIDFLAGGIVLLKLISTRSVPVKMTHGSYLGDRRSDLNFLHRLETIGH